jgi:hypothetical protein
MRMQRDYPIQQGIMGRVCSVCMHACMHIPMDTLQCVCLGAPARALQFLEFVSCGMNHTLQEAALRNDFERPILEAPS